MEITTTAQRRTTATPWRRLVLLVVVVAPVAVLSLLPIGLGLERYVVSGDSMDAGPRGLARGTLLLERQVPVADLRVGDVITYRPPASSGVDGMVTHRVVRVRPAAIRTRGDAEPAADPWILRPAEPTVPRVVASVPWIGYLYLLLVRPSGAVALAAIPPAGMAIVLVGRATGRRRRQE